MLVVAMMHTAACVEQLALGIFISWGNGDLLPNVHVGLLCYGKGFMLVVASVGQWLAEVLEGPSLDKIPNAKDLRSTYSLFGLDTQTLDVLV